MAHSSAMTATTTTIEGLTEFTVFPKLPIEVRRRIFGCLETPYRETHIHAIRGFPQHILKDKVRDAQKQPIEPSPPSQLQWPNADFEWPENTAITYFTWYLQGGCFLSTTAPRIPPLLHTCKESRRLLIEKHNLVHAFGTLFNLDHDILFLDASTAIHYAEVSNPGIEAFAELLHHPELIKTIKRIAFHAQIYDYIWLTKCAEKIKGQLASLEELYLAWGIDGGPRTVQKQVPNLTGQNIFFLDVTQDGFDREFCTSNLRVYQGDIKKDMEKRWINALPDYEDPNYKGKFPKFRHVFAKNKVPGYNNGVVSFREFVRPQPMVSSVPSKQKSNSLHQKAVKNAAMKGTRY